MKNKYIRAIFPYATWLAYGLLLAWGTYNIKPFGAISENVYAYAGLMFIYSLWFATGYNRNSENFLGILIFVIFVSFGYAQLLSPLEYIIQPIFLVGHVIAGVFVGTMTEIAVTGETKRIIRNKIGSIREHK